MKHTIRPVARIIQSHRQREGGGFIVRRPFPSAGLSHIDPFLLIDEMGPADYGPGEAIGAPDHPHRGFETVTYMLEGEFEHEDSAGHRGTIRPGDVQWMTAGAGIIHSEMPSRRIREDGGRIHGFQIWVNLPSKLKLTRPRYQEVSSSEIPRAKSEDGLAEVRVVAGEAFGASAVINTHTPIIYQDFTVKPGGEFTERYPSEQRLLLYVFRGAVELGGEEGEAGQTVNDGQLALLGEGEAIRVRVPEGASEDARFLLLGGAPMGEPVARYGPFVMNTQEELVQAFRDFESGKMGEITRSASHR